MSTKTEIIDIQVCSTNMIFRLLFQGSILMSSLHRFAYMNICNRKEKLREHSLLWLTFLLSYRVTYKEILVPIMMIEHTIFDRSNTILSDQNSCSLTYNIMEKVLVNILLDQDDLASIFCPIICDFARSYDRRSAL